MYSPESYVHLIDIDQELNPDEKIACSLLQETGPYKLDVLVSRLAEATFREELALGGWAVDIGFWGSRLFHQDVLRIILDMNNRCISIAPIGNYEGKGEDQG
jgi:hypothetical protein